MAADPARVSRARVAVRRTWHGSWTRRQADRVGRARRALGMVDVACALVDGGRHSGARRERAEPKCRAVRGGRVAVGIEMIECCASNRPRPRDSDASTLWRGPMRRRTRSLRWPVTAREILRRLSTRRSRSRRRIRTDSTLCALLTRSQRARVPADLDLDWLSERGEIRRHLSRASRLDLSVHSPAALLTVHRLGKELYAALSLSAPGSRCCPTSARATRAEVCGRRPAPRPRLYCCAPACACRRRRHAFVSVCCSVPIPRSSVTLSCRADL